MAKPISLVQPWSRMTGIVGSRVFEPRGFQAYLAPFSSSSRLFCFQDYLRLNLTSPFLFWGPHRWEWTSNFLNMTGNSTLTCSDPKNVFETFDSLSSCIETYYEDSYSDDIYYVGSNNTVGNLVQNCLNDYCKNPVDAVGGCGSWSNTTFNPFQFSAEYQWFWSEAACDGVRNTVNSDMAGNGVSQYITDHEAQTDDLIPPGVHLVLDAARNHFLLLLAPPHFQSNSKIDVVIFTKKV